MKKIFLDVGANTGTNIGNFRKHYGDDYDIYSFDANPKCIAEIKKKYDDDSKVTVMEYAASNEDGTAEFYLGPGETSVRSSLRSDKTTGISKDRNITVARLDLSKWIKENFEESDQIILYLDIEGGEYDVLEKLIDENMLSWFNEVYVEFHETKLRNLDMDKHKFIYDKLIEVYDKNVYIHGKYQAREYERVG
tara:strand:- start:145 stop:723 length:579 start_codon:yes stop_codon:yes gene_type:complete